MLQDLSPPDPDETIAAPADQSEVDAAVDAFAEDEMIRLGTQAGIDERLQEIQQEGQDMQLSDDDADDGDDPDENFPLLAEESPEGSSDNGTIGDTDDD
jgi:ribosome assembly protein YihI (activator of Der GTPase)